ncbi:hypothetical protein P167DRAFT_534144 [Morchella conica CCBAS932]|uniref:Secreted protein n=1 Tax=Morchella conica CCBAS932 TaxID=1392247 RepID=A0A3N4L8I1_9PEZI|nr:hypothetical protein P167DRAFT_534144 [Morchella conica CCBAS932]
MGSPPLTLTLLGEVLFTTVLHLHADTEERQIATKFNECQIYTHIYSEPQYRMRCYYMYSHDVVGPSLKSTCHYHPTRPPGLVRSD